MCRYYIFSSNLCVCVCFFFKSMKCNQCLVRINLLSMAYFLCIMLTRMNMGWDCTVCEQDGSKKLSKDEMMKVLQTDEVEAEKMIKEIDADGDGMIDYEEFLKMWRGKEKIAGHTNEEIHKQLSEYE